MRRFYQPHARLNLVIAFAGIDNKRMPSFSPSLSVDTNPQNHMFMINFVSGTGRVRRFQC